MIANRKLVLRFAILSIALLAIFSLLPFRPTATRHGTTGHWILHVLSFGITAVLTLALTVDEWQERICAFCLICFAIAIEVSQALLGHQKVEWLDVLLDAFGIMAAVALFRIARVTSNIRRR